jgi:hypothetical protein
MYIYTITQLDTESNSFVELVDVDKLDPRDADAAALISVLADIIVSTCSISIAEKASAA